MSIQSFKIYISKKVNRRVFLQFGRLRSFLFRFKVFEHVDSMRLRSFEKCFKKAAGIFGSLPFQDILTGRGKAEPGSQGLQRNIRAITPRKVDFMPASSAYRGRTVYGCSFGSLSGRFNCLHFLFKPPALKS